MKKAIFIVCIMLSFGFMNLYAKSRCDLSMKPYTILGKKYYPKKVRVGDTMQGISSWYGKDFHQQKTSNGEVFNMHSFTAAHKTLPMHTRVRVTNLVNHKSTIVRINDRGPFVKGRIIDCSYKAGKKLGLDKMGIAKVKVEVLSLCEKGVKTKKKYLKPKKVKVVKKQIKKEPKIITYYLNPPFVLQIASFKAKRFATSLKHKKNYQNKKVVIKKFFDITGKKIYRVFIVGFYSKKEANRFKSRYGLNKALILKG